MIHVIDTYLKHDTYRVFTYKSNMLQICGKYVTMIHNIVFLEKDKKTT